MHQYQMTILERHLDILGHVNNAIYLSLLEEARWDMIKEHNFTLDTMRAVGIGPVVLEIQIKFIKELVLGQKIMIETVTLNARSRIATIEQKILNEKNEVCTEACLKIGIFDLKTRKLVPSNHSWEIALGIKKKEDL